MSSSSKSKGTIHSRSCIEGSDRLSINPGTVCVQMAIPGPHSRLWGEGSHL